MAPVLRVLMPEGTTNYIENPSLRFDTTGWNAVGAVISRVLDQTMFGISSLKVVTSGAALREGVYYRVNTLVGISEPITISAYVKGSGVIHLRLINSGGKEWVSSGTTLSSERWTRLEVSGYSTGTNDLRLYVETDGSAPKAITFYVDGAQMERKPYATTYCDGYQIGCRWNGTDSSSSSTRESYTRSGGRWLILTGPERFNPNIYITLTGGLGMPPVINHIQEWATTPGAFYQGKRISDRSITLKFHITNPIPNVSRGDGDASILHGLRQQIIDIFKPDVTAEDEPIVLSYTDGPRTIYLRAHYESGLDGDWDIRNEFSSYMVVRLLANDPFWYEENKIGLGLSYGVVETNVNSVAMRVDGLWQKMNYGISTSSTYKIVAGKKGEIYMVGAFTTANNSALAIDPFIPGNYIIRWDGTKWNRVGTGANATIRDIAVAANGDLYVTGDFTTIDGVAANRIAKYSYATGTWSALGTGLNSTGNTIVVTVDFRVYVGGTFTQAGGINAYRVAYWDGSWHQMGARRGVDSTVTSIVIGLTGTLVYIGGSFQNENGLATNLLKRVAQYNVSTNTFSQVGAGFDNSCTELALSTYTNTLYAVGTFLNSGSVSCSRVAYYNGSSWSQLGTGINSYTVNNISLVSDREIYFSVNYPPTGFYMWNGADYVPVDIRDVTGTANIKIFLANNNLYLAGSSLTSLHHASQNIVNNPGTALVYPMIYIYGPGRIQWVENYTTRQRVFLDLTIYDNEELFIDFSTGKIISTMRGNLTFETLPGSDMRLSLIPGNNLVSVFMTDDVSSLMYMYFTPAHWAIDATMDPGIPL